jgi:hypothetical protein
MAQALAQQLARLTVNSNQVGKNATFYIDYIFLELDCFNYAL